MRPGGTLRFLSAALPLVALATVAPRGFANPQPSDAASAASLTVFAVRHAEKETGGPDPSLTTAGHRRADTLARVLEDAGITAVFSSEFKRSQETAAPLARRLGVPVAIVPAKDLDALVSRVRGLPSGGRSLVVAHGNTLPLLVTRLTGVTVAEMTEADHDRLYVLTSRGDGRGDVVLLHYGDSRPGASSAGGVAIPDKVNAHLSMIPGPTLGSKARQPQTNEGSLRSPLSLVAPQSRDGELAP